MSEFDNGFDRAQKMYDAMEPPEFYRKTCPRCKGDGEVEDEKTGFPIVCPNCEGNGEV